ncbi:MAG: holin [Bacillus sp. (in: firmicutes)]|jgi:phi LC3 family holin|nr:holin [Bacillus sp. (in: firmicutes)]
MVQMVLSGLHSIGVTEFQLTDDFRSNVLSFANTIFVIFSFFGIIQDPTTKGYRDSVHALTYEKPK